MDIPIIQFLASEVVMVVVAYLLKVITYKTANKAIATKRLSTGIYYFFPIEGERAVRLAKGYISGVKIVFWFSVLFIPFIFVIAVFNGTVRL